jgi:hypothetical protein
MHCAHIAKGASLMLSASVIAFALVAVPLTFDPVTSDFGMAKAWAKGSGGGNGGGGNGNGNDNGGSNGRGNSQDKDHASNGQGKGLSKDLDNEEADIATNGYAYGKQSKVAKDDPMHPSNLGRLNGFFNASSTALKNASPNSAIGIVSQTYRDALSAYLGSLEEDTEEQQEEALDDLAAVLAQAANKPLSPEQIEAINERLATENPEDANLANLVDEDVEEGEDATDQVTNTELSAELADRANEVQDSESNQGLGAKIADTVEDAADAVSEAF